MTKSEEKDTKTVKIGYIRVSSIDDRQKLGFEAQKRILTSFGVDYLYAEKQSGRKDDRVEFNRAVKKAEEFAKKGMQVTVVVYKLDRLGRKAATLLNVIQKFDDCGIKFVSIHENINTTTPMGKMMMQFLSIFAELELPNISERTKLGLEQARRDGVLLGRPRIDEKKRLKIASMYQNRSLRICDIAKRCHVSAGTVTAIAKQQGLSRRKN